MIGWLKFLHIAALILWVAGLLYLPAMLIGHRRAKDPQDFARVRMGSRFVYMGVASPAAFVAVAAGTALLFVADALHPWMVLKLVVVGILVVAHIQAGHILVHLADEEARAPTFRAKAVAGAAAGSAAAILLLVLAKPPVPIGLLPGWMLEPGVLNRPDAPPPVPHPPRPQS